MSNTTEMDGEGNTTVATLLGVEIALRKWWALRTQNCQQDFFCFEVQNSSIQKNATAWVDDPHYLQKNFTVYFCYIILVHNVG